MAHKKAGGSSKNGATATDNAVVSKSMAGK